MCGKAAVDGLTHPICQTRRSIDGCFIIMDYIGSVKKLIYVFKYKPFVTDTQHVIGELFYEGLIQKEAAMRILGEKHDVLLMPIPLHKNKLRQRGYNHAAILTKQLAKRLGVSFCDCLIREKETKIQAGLSKKERKENIHDAFRVTKNVILKEKTVFIIDDIVTSGATFVEAARMLKKAGAKAVYGLAFSGEY